MFSLFHKSGATLAPLASAETTAKSPETEGPANTAAADSEPEKGSGVFFIHGGRLPTQQELVRCWRQVVKAVTANGLFQKHA